MSRDVDNLINISKDLRTEMGDDFHDVLTEAIYSDASEIASHVIISKGDDYRSTLDSKIDRIVTSKIWGFPIMLLILAAVLWITIIGANYPSALLSDLLLDKVYGFFNQIMVSIGSPKWLRGFLIDGVYLALAWVIAVMLPPMAIFFPIFTLLEDFGYLPRVSFNLDKIYQNVGAHGKQALTMTMGFGCNAAGVVATRIIDSPRERLIAIITNNFSLCNGRWPTQILLATIFIGVLVPSQWSSAASVGAVFSVALLGILSSFFISWILSRTLLRGEVSTFHLELPPYRPPQFLQTLYTSLIDRTLIVLWRAIVFAAPAGAVIWLISNIHIGNQSIALHLIESMDGFGWLLGLNGVILLAYIVAIPANEIVIPTVLMLTVMSTGLNGVGEGAGVMFELDSLSQTKEILTAGGWTLLTAINLMLFSLLHNPCSTTIYTIFKETKSWKWTAFATVMPVLMGFVVTFLVAQLWRLFVG